MIKVWRIFGTSPTGVEESTLVDCHTQRQAIGIARARWPQYRAHHCHIAYKTIAACRQATQQARKESRGQDPYGNHRDAGHLPRKYQREVC